MEDLDRELKLVQLQRERLALKREIAFQGMGGAAKKVSKALGRAVAVPFRALGRFFRKWWKVILSVVLVVGCIGAAVAWVGHSKAEAQRLAEERWWAKATAYGKEACPETQVAYSSAYESAQGESYQKICEYRAWLKYEQQVPRPKSK